MALVIQADLDAVPVPPEGPVMFVLTLNDHDGRLDGLDVQLVEAFRGLVEQVAPGRATAVVLPHGWSLEALSDGNLAGIGLARVS